MPSSSPPHPLATRLIARLMEVHANVSNISVLEIGTGSGRNTHALSAAGLSVKSLADVDVIPSERSESRNGNATFAAALTTHGLLHGHPNDILQRVKTIALQLKPQGLLYATFGSVNDRRFGTGEKLGTSTFAPVGGDETGVPHSYFTEAELHDLLQAYFDVERLEELCVDAIAGSWAHTGTPLVGAMHWFVEAVRH